MLLKPGHSFVSDYSEFNVKKKKDIFSIVIIRTLNEGSLTFNQSKESG